MAVLVPEPEPVLGVLPQALMATPLACWTRMWQYQQSRGRPRKTLRWYGVHLGDGGCARVPGPDVRDADRLPTRMAR